MKRGQPWLHVDPPKMKPGDAERMSDMSEQVGLPLVPWQRDFLDRLESASMSKQFGEIVRDSLT